MKVQQVESFEISLSKFSCVSIKSKASKADNMILLEFQLSCVLNECQVYFKEKEQISQNDAA